jgi:hypothetical protein
MLIDLSFNLFDFYFKVLLKSRGTQFHNPTIIMASTNRSRGGRIRVTDDSIVTIGTNVEVRAEHVNAVNATRTKESSDETQKGHCCRLKKLMQWWMAEYPDYFEIGTRVLSEEEQNDPMKFLSDLLP